MPDTLLPALASLVQSATGFLREGLDTVLAGPPGCGTSSIRERIAAELSKTPKLRLATLDVRDLAGAEWNRASLERLLPAPAADETNLVIVENTGDLSADDLQTLAVAARELAQEAEWSFFWVGSLDARAVAGDPLHDDPRAHLCFPELGQEDLLALYRTIAAQRECRWGEALLFFALDWCGNDLALAASLAKYFYGDWSEKLWDQTVAETLADWLAHDELVAEYRDRLAALPAECRRHLALLAAGGKLVCQRPEIHREPEAHIRRLYLDGFLTTNLLPGYYQLRNLLVVALLEEGQPAPQSPLALLRRAANARVNALLQDVETSFRRMLLARLRTMPEANWKALLTGKKSDRKLFEAEVRKGLLGWATANAAEHKAGISKQLADLEAADKLNNNLWTKVCAVFREDTKSAADAEPPLQSVVEYLTFNELADVLLSQPVAAFIATDYARLAIEPPANRWPNYLTSIRRLRNQVAHLRNVSFQDIEDLLQTVRMMREDQRRFFNLA